MHVATVLARVARAAARAGRDPTTVRIVAVTKGHSVAVAREAASEGFADLGENRVQEALAKMDEWPDAPVRWHLIGHLQRNKAKLAVGRFAMIHSVDSTRLADELEKHAAARGITQDVLVQVNVAREAQKAGAAPEAAQALVEHVKAQPHLGLKGLMAMAPLTSDETVQRTTFRGLRELKERCVAAGLLDAAAELSMGMSQDFEVAVEEGATLLRLGTVLFGERQ